MGGNLQNVSRLAPRTITQDLYYAIPGSNGSTTTITCTDRMDDPNTRSQCLCFVFIADLSCSLLQNNARDADLLSYWCDFTWSIVSVIPTCWQSLQIFLTKSNDAD